MVDHFETIITGVWSVVRQKNEREHQVYRTMVRPALVYGAETLALKKAEENKLEVAEM